MNARHAQRIESPVANLEALRDLFEDLAWPIRVLSPHMPVIRHSIPTLENPLRRQPATHTVRESVLARNDSGENPFRSQETAHFSEGRREVVQMFQNVNRYHAVKIVVGIRQARSPSRAVLMSYPCRRTYHETRSEAFDATEEGVGLDKRFRPPDLVEALAGLVSTQFAQLCQPLVQGR
jgi:hypothetical protein